MEIKNIRKNFSFVFVIGCWLVMRVSLRVYDYFYFGYLNEYSWVSNIDIYLFYLIEFLILLFALKKFNYSIHSFVGKEKVRLTPIIEGIVTMAVVVLFSFTTYFVLYPFLAHTAFSFDFISGLVTQIRRGRVTPQLLSWRGIRSLTVWLIIAPVFEEFIYRGFLLQALSEWLGKSFALIISSIIFSAIHTDRDFINYFILFLLGLLCGMIYLRTKQLIYPIMAHFAFNLFIVYIQPMIMQSVNLMDYFDTSLMMLGAPREYINVEIFRETQITFFICLFLIIGYITWNAVKIYDEKLPYHYNLDRLARNENE